MEQPTRKGEGGGGPIYLRRTTQSKKIRVRKAISEAIFGAGEQYLLCEYAMLCRAIGALASENDAAGFELPIRKVNAKAWNHGLRVRKK